MAGSRANMISTFRFTDPRRLYVFVALRLVVFLSVRTVAADMPCAGVRQQYDDVASRTIQANLALEGRVERVIGDSARMMVVRVLTVFKDRRLRRRATSSNSSRLRIAVDLRSLAGTYSDDSSDDVDDVGRVTSLVRGARFIVFLRHRHTDDTLTYYVISGGRRRRRNVDLYRVSASPSAVTESVRQTVKKYSKRRNGKYSQFPYYRFIQTQYSYFKKKIKI